MDDRTKTALDWPDLIYAQFRRVGIRQVGYVPDAGHSRLIELCVKDPNIHDVVLTTEEGLTFDSCRNIALRQMT